MEQDYRGGTPASSGYVLGGQHLLVRLSSAMSVAPERTDTHRQESESQAFLDCHTTPLSWRIPSEACPAIQSSSPPSLEVTLVLLSRPLYDIGYLLGSNGFQVLVQMVS